MGPPGPPWGWGPREKFSGVTPCERPWLLDKIPSLVIVNRRTGFASRSSSSSAYWKRIKFQDCVAASDWTTEYGAGLI